MSIKVLSSCCNARVFIRAPSDLTQNPESLNDLIFTLHCSNCLNEISALIDDTLENKEKKIMDILIAFVSNSKIFPDLYSYEELLVKAIKFYEGVQNYAKKL
jgi:hypothetical protein